MRKHGVKWKIYECVGDEYGKGVEVLVRHGVPGGGGHSLRLPAHTRRVQVLSTAHVQSCIVEY